MLLSLLACPGNSCISFFLSITPTSIGILSPPRSVFIRTPSSPLYLTVATLIEKKDWAALHWLTEAGFDRCQSESDCSIQLLFQPRGCRKVCEWHTQDWGCAEEPVHAGLHVL